MPQQMAKALTVHLYMMNFLKTHTCSYKEAIDEMNKTFPGWFETDGDPMIIDWIEEHTTS